MQALFRVRTRGHYAGHTLLRPIIGDRRGKDRRIEEVIRIHMGGNCNVCRATRIQPRTLTFAALSLRSGEETGTHIPARSRTQRAAASCVPNQAPPFAWM